MAGVAAAGVHRSSSVLFRLSLPFRPRSSMRRRPLVPVGFGSRRTGMVPTGSPDIGRDASRQSASARAIRACAASRCVGWNAALRSTILKIESTVRYLGVDIEDALALAEGTVV